METENSRKRRRRYDAALKAQIVAECDEPGASVTNVAMAHGINANIVHVWRKLARQADATGAPVRFVPVTGAPACRETADEMAVKEELLARERREVAFKQALIDKLTHELAILRRLKYAVTSEKFCAGMSAEQKSLLEETLDSDIAQLSAELEQAANDKAGEKDNKAKETPKREPLPRTCRGATYTTSRRTRPALAAAR